MFERSQLGILSTNCHLICSFLLSLTAASCSAVSPWKRTASAFAATPTIAGSIGATAGKSGVR